jgi:hypothetical protein
MNKPENTQDRVYLLRIWKTQSEQDNSWRFSLENAQTGTRRGFSDLSALTVFLEAQLIEQT